MGLTARRGNRMPDKVKCNWCETIQIIESDSETCLECKKKGYLVDIEQDIEDEVVRIINKG